MERRVLRFENIFLRMLNKNENLKGKHAELISGVTGEIVSGRLSVIMGGSGSSKTSFLNLLVGKVDSSTLTSGTVTLDGEQRETRNWLSNFSYLEQFDVFMPNLTVEESIRYSLIFRERETKPLNVEKRVNSIINELELTEIRGSLISSISGGERKRAMLAVELIVEPEVIFLDEPTTGLDSHLALDTVKILRRYARNKNKIVLMTVHQPGDGMFSLFDDIIFLNKGSIFYSGPASGIDEFLSINGLERPQELSVAEYLFELHARSPRLPSKEIQARVEKICKNKEAKMPDEDALENDNQYCIVSTVSWCHIWHLLVRQLKIDYRSGTMRNVFLFKILMSTMLFFFLCDKMRYSVFSFISKVYPTYTQAGEEYVDDLRVFLTRRYECLGISYEEMLDFFAYNMVPFLTSFSIFNDSAFLDQNTFLRKESFTCEYSQLSLFTSILIYECGFSLIRSLYFCSILSFTQLRAVLTIRAILMFVLIPLGMVIFMNLAKSFSSNTYPLNTTRVAAFVLTTFLRPLWLSQELKELENRYAFMKYLYPGTYILFLCPFLLLDALFYVTLGGKESISSGFISFLKKINGIPAGPRISPKKALNQNITFLNKHFLSDEFLVILSVFSVASALVLSVTLLVLKFSPNVRLTLSNKSLGKKLDEVTIN